MNPKIETRNLTGKEILRFVFLADFSKHAPAA